jgi:hypothetical protein
MDRWRNSWAYGANPWWIGAIPDRQSNLWNNSWTEEEALTHRAILGLMEQFLDRSDSWTEGAIPSSDGASL